MCLVCFICVFDVCVFSVLCVCSACIASICMHHDTAPSCTQLTLQPPGPATPPQSDEIDVVCMDTQIDDLMTFNEKDMIFWVSKFSINGTWHGYEYTR